MTFDEEIESAAQDFERSVSRIKPLRRPIPCKLFLGGQFVGEVKSVNVTKGEESEVEE